MAEEVNKNIIQCMTLSNNVACKRLADVSLSEVHETCEKFKEMAGMIASYMQMVSPTTVEFLRNHGADYSKLKDAPTSCNQLRVELESVRDYLIEMLSYVD